MEWTKLLGLCVLAAALTFLLRQINPPSSMLLAAAFGAMALFAALPQIKSFAEEIQEFLDGLGLEAAYYKTMLKAMGISLMTQIAVGVCTDVGAASAAKHAELCGRLALMSVAVPVFMQLTQLAVGVLS